jgi:hypothetical protein
MSEDYPTLAAALAAVQARLPEIRKGETAKVATKTGGSYVYAYASLSDVSMAILPLLGAAGLCWITRPTVNDAGRLVLAYELRHTSGESVTGEYPLSPGTPQDVGSQITYFRRYLLCAVAGVAPDEDDDGAAASKTGARGGSSDAWASATPARPRNVTTTIAPTFAEGATSQTTAMMTAVGATQRNAIIRAAQGIEQGSDSAAEDYLEAQRITDVHATIPGRDLSLHTLLARNLSTRIAAASDDAALRIVWNFAKRVDMLAATLDGGNTVNDRITARRGALLAEASASKPAATDPPQKPQTAEEAIAVLNAGGLTVEEATPVRRPR